LSESFARQCILGLPLIINFSLQQSKTISLSERELRLRVMVDKRAQLDRGSTCV